MQSPKKQKREARREAQAKAEAAAAKAELETFDELRERLVLAPVPEGGDDDDETCTIEDGEWPVLRELARRFNLTMVVENPTSGAQETCVAFYDGRVVWVPYSEADEVYGDDKDKDDDDDDEDDEEEDDDNKEEDGEEEEDELPNLDSHLVRFKEDIDFDVTLPRGREVIFTVFSDGMNKARLADLFWKAVKYGRSDPRLEHYTHL